MQPKALVLTSSAPLPNEMLKIKRLYWVGLALLPLGLIAPPLVLIGVCALLGIYVIDYISISAKQRKLRSMQFGYDSSISADELLNRLQPVLFSKYGTQMTVEKNEAGRVSISFNAHIYDIHIGNDNTMKIWWRKSLSGAMLSVNEYKSYKKNLNSMGILVYEIQQCCNMK